MFFSKVQQIQLISSGGATSACLKASCSPVRPPKGDLWRTLPEGVPRRCATPRADAWRACTHDAARRTAALNASSELSNTTYVAHARARPLAVAAQSSCAAASRNIPRRLPASAIPTTSNCNYTFFLRAAAASRRAESRYNHKTKTRKIPLMTIDAVCRNL